MTPALVIALCLLVLLPFTVMLVILVNMAIANYRECKAEGREMEPIDRDFLRLCYVTLMVAIWLKGW